MPRKTVAIRGLDTEIYHEVFSMAKRDGKRVAEVVNYALKEFLNGGYNDKGVNGGGEGNGMNTFTLKNNGEISLSKRDIISLKEEVGPFRIETYGRITFEKDIDKESLGNINRIIIHDGTVEVPRGLYPQFLIKSEIYGKIDKY